MNEYIIMMVECTCKTHIISFLCTHESSVLCDGCVTDCGLSASSVVSGEKVNILNF